MRNLVGAARSGTGQRSLELKPAAWRLLGASVIAGLFAAFTWRGLTFYLDTDDVMNIRAVFVQPAVHWVKACLIYSAGSYRPLGQLAYRVLYGAFGLHAFYYHLICLLIAGFNVGLLWWFARKISGSEQAAWIAALLGCVHLRMDSLYLSAGNLYDLICYTLFAAAFLYYTAGEPGFSVFKAAVLILLQLLALDAKEMAAMLPVVLFAYELILAGGKPQPRWIYLGLLTIESAAFMLPKLLMPSPLTQSYRPVYSMARLAINWDYYLSQLFYSFHSFPDWVTLGIVITLLAVAVWLRSRVLIFSFVFLIVTTLPVSFVDTRGLNTWYIASAGWMVYFAVVLTRLWPCVPVARRTGFAGLFVTAAILMTVLLTRQLPYAFMADSAKDIRIRLLGEETKALCPGLSGKSSILFVNDAFNGDEWTPVSYLQLLYGDPNMEIQRLRLTPQVEQIPSRDYDCVFDYRGGHYSLTRMHQYQP